MTDHVNGSPIIHRGNAIQVLAQCTMELISRRQRPYLFRVKVWGQPPHAVTRIYDIAGANEEAVARVAIARFTKEMQHPLSIFGAMV
jgi:hypothetical protein